MSQPEILAPAGSYESLLAAVRCGANGVYLGLEGFNARQNAKNFDKDGLKQAADYCHERDVKVYLTLNTLIHDSEISSAMEALDMGVQAGADGVIVQDWGLLRLMRESSCPLPVHGSTQMTIHNREGAIEAKKMGLSRVVLAREISLPEIEKITQSGVETEAFVHGALCMSMSGQCYVSSLLGGRSGNRGLCAQPCRLPFSVPGGTGHDLSLKDLSALSELPNLRRMGVTSFKIEGRMKRPEYVAAAVTACVQALDENRQQSRWEETQKALKAVFSRSGFTNGYMEGKLGKSMFGTRQKEDVDAAKDVLKDLSRLAEKETPLLSLQGSLSIHAEKPMQLTLTYKEYTVRVTGEVPGAAQNRPIEEDEVRSQMSKTGNTPYFFEDMAVTLEEGLYLPKAALNDLRRQGFEALASRMKKPVPRWAVPKTLPAIQPFEEKQQKPVYSGVFTNPEAIPSQAGKLDRIFISVMLPEKEIQRVKSINNNTFCYLPRAVFDSTSVRKAIEKCKAMDIDTLLCPNIGAVGLAKEYGMTAVGDFGLNVFNSQSLAMLKECGLSEAVLSFELKAAQINHIKDYLPVNVLIYGRLPLMLLRNCPNKNGGGCHDCTGADITDRKDIAFPLRCDGTSTELLNSLPLYMGDKKNDFLTTQRFFLRFTTESRGECGEVLEKIFSGKSFDKPYTRGLYYRGVD